MPQRSHRILAALLYSLLLLPGVSHCARPVPSLIAVSELSPARVEPRDVLFVKGEGFVPAADATLRFRGTAHQPGRPPQAVDFRLLGQAVDRETVEVIVSGGMVRAMCGEGGEDNLEASHHATFRGEVEVAFSPRVSGAPPIVGRATDVVLDVFPGLSDLTDDALVPRSREWLGLDVRKLGADGLEVTALTPDFPAERAGILVGDVLRSWSSVRVHSVRDLEPYPGQQSAVVTLERKGMAGAVQVLVDVTGYAPLGASGWGFGLVLLGLFAAVVVMSRTRLSQWFIWLALNANARPRNTSAYHRSLALWPFLIVSGLFLGLSTRQPLGTLQLDLAWLALFASVMVALFGTAAAFRRGRWSLRALLLTWWRQTPIHLVLWMAVVVLVLERGSASVWELGQPQTIDPRSLGAFTSPVSFFIAWALLATFVGVWLGRYSTGSDSENASAGLLARFSRSAGDLYCLLVAAVLVAVFAGGWSVSALAVEQLGLAEALSFQARFTTLFVGLVWLRRNVPAPPMRVVESWTLRLACPLVTLGLVLLPVWWAEVWPFWLRMGVQNLLLAMTLLILVGVPSAAVFVRRRAELRRLRFGLNPWL